MIREVARIVSRVTPRVMPLMLALALAIGGVALTNAPALDTNITAEEAETGQEGHENSPPEGETPSGEPGHEPGVEDDLEAPGADGNGNSAGDDQGNDEPDDTGEADGTDAADDTDAAAGQADGDEPDPLIEDPTAQPFSALSVSGAEVRAPAKIQETRNIRLGGEDRYETAVAVSKHTYPNTASTVFIASGEDFPDALSAAALAAKLDAPLLLTAGKRVPAATMTELRRLTPDRIVIVGGTGVVTNGVASTLRGVASKVDRLAGADRYATSAAVAKHGWSTSSHVFIASGLGYADALSAGAAAAKLGAPVILVPGNLARAPKTSADAVSRLKASTLHVAGGPGAVHASMPGTLKKGTITTVRRYGGSDRYETSSLMSRSVFGAGAADVYWANGLGFPDALAGASAAGARGGALVLVRDTCVPATSYLATKRMVPGSTILLGGPGALTNSVLHGNECVPRPAGMSNTDWNTANQLYRKINAERYGQKLGALRIGTTGQWNAAQAQAKQYASANPKLNANLRSSQPAVRYQSVARTGSGDRSGRLYQLMRGDAGTRNWMNLPNGGASNAVSVGVASGGGRSTGVLYFSVRTS